MARCVYIGRLSAAVQIDRQTDTQKIGRTNYEGRFCVELEAPGRLPNVPESGLSDE